MKQPVESLCVYCGSSAGGRPSYRAAADQLGRIMAEAGIRLIYGGGQTGLMGALAGAALKHGGQVCGIIPHFLDQAEHARRDLTELLITDSMHERKRRMEEMADGFIILPGGLGTMEEAFEILTWRQLKLHSKPVIAVNLDGYWDHFIHLLEHLVSEGFVKPEHYSMLRVVEHVTDILPALKREAPR